MGDICLSIAGILNCQHFQICHFKEIKRMEMHSEVADLICTRKAVKAVVYFYTWIANWKLLVQKWGKQSLPWEHVFHYRAVSLCLPEICCRTFPEFKKRTLLSWTEKWVWGLFKPRASCNGTCEMRPLNVSLLTGKRCLMRLFGFYANYISSCCVKIIWGHPNCNAAT